jgi:DNA-binding CsgD family transcriptional regulator
VAVEGRLQTRSLDDQRDADIVASLAEAQVLRWVARGRLNRETAELLFISTATVRKAP